MPRSGYKYTYVPGRYLGSMDAHEIFESRKREKSVLHFICLRTVQSGTLILGIYIPTMRNITGVLRQSESPTYCVYSHEKHSLPPWSESFPDCDM